MNFFWLFFFFFPLSLAADNCLFENWNAYKNSLEKRGIKTEFYYQDDLLGNPYGGKSQGFAEAGSLGLIFGFDLHKLYGWQGWSFYNSWIIRTGRNLSEKIGNVFQVAQTYGGQTWVMDHLYLEKSLLDGDLLFRFGRLGTGEDFLTSPLYTYYTSYAFNGNPIGPFFNAYMSSVPFATWGAYLQYKINSHFMIKMGAYNANDTVEKLQYHGFNFHFHAKQGTQLISTITYIPGYRLLGNYTLGAYRYTGTFEKVRGQEVEGNWGYYVQMEQELYKKILDSCTEVINAFTALTFNPKDRSVFPFFFNAGIICNGIIPFRPDDSLVFGVAYGSYSSIRRELQSEAYDTNTPGRFGKEAQNFEMVLEGNYVWQVNEKCRIQPDVQYILQPSGKKSIPNAVVVGAQITLVL